MIGEKEIQRYREMSLEDKLHEFELLMDVAFTLLMDLPPDERRRRWEIWMRSDEESAATLAKRLMEAGK